MSKKYELFDESSMDSEDLETERDAQLAAVDAIRRARRYGTYYVISEDDQVKKIPGDKTGPYEERLLASAARLDQRIAEFRAHQQEEPTAVLNDKSAAKPPQK